MRTKMPLAVSLLLALALLSYCGKAAIQNSGASHESVCQRVERCDKTAVELDLTGAECEKTMADLQEGPKRMFNSLQTCLLETPCKWLSFHGCMNKSMEPFIN